MRVALHVDQLWADAPGGIGTYTRELAQALLRTDPAPDLTLFHARFGTSEPPEDWMRSCSLVQIPASIRSLYPRWNTTGRPALPAALASAEVIHAPLPVAIPPAARGQRLVVTVHDLAFLVTPHAFPARWRAMYRLGLRAAVARADAVIAPSRNTAEDLVARTSIDPGRVHVVPEAASLPHGDPDPDATLDRLRIPRPYVLSVGTLEPRKNLVRLVRAYRRLAADGIPHALVLAGSMGWGEQALHRELALDGPGEIVLTGRLSAADLDSVYRGASAFAYVSLYEGFGLPVLEAMARGVPVVSSDASSLPEVAGDAATYVDPTSVRDITDGLRRVVADTALAESLARAGAQRAARYSWDDTARRTLEVYAGP